ncbi:unnamed protein product [Hymenolepis diminuta]|uniref:MFS domain-containing protein n=3 Tax=Hymenolepis diminuta TaxID=6216 RepID=A0A0R3SLT1_HYMDI|nr:unnamed protein product [Hymenolepis diminuta]VUZ43145.1 unnamed protein product [Hymenolepis diminuta]
MARKIVTGVLTIVGAFIFNLSMGYYYTMGNMSPYLAAYMKIKTSETVWFNSVALAFQAMTMPLGGILHMKFGFRLPVILGSILGWGGMFLSRLTVDHGMGPFIVTYCIMFGFGIGLPYSVFLSVASSWFPEHRSIIVGLIAAGYGLGALVFTPIQTALINPNNNPNFSDPDVTSRVPNAFLIFGGIILGMQIIGLLISREYKPDNVKIPLDDSEINSSATHADETFEDDSSYDSYLEKTMKAANPKPVVSYTVLEALKCPDFYFIWFAMLFGVVTVTLQSSTFKSYGKWYISDDQYLSAIATTSSAFNFIGRITWGIISDRFSFKCPMNILYISWAIMQATFPFISQSSAFKALYPIWVFILYFQLAGHYVLAPATAGRIFGPRYLSTIYGLIFFANAPGTLILSAVVSQFNIDGKWVDVYLSCMAACLVSFCFSLFLKDVNGTCMAPTQFIAKLCDPCRHPPSAMNEENSDYSEDIWNEDLSSKE